MAAGSTTSAGYRAFISYSHRDQTWAQWLHKAIETYRVPSRLVGQTTASGVIPRRLAPVFRDRDELASATDLGRKVNEALAQSANLIVICSPQAAASRWVNEEVLAYKRLGRADRIFCLIVAGEPNATDLAGRAGEECFCEALRFTVDASGRLTSERTEPIAADARPGADGKPNARLKLIAGMLDVGFDALKQRELQRRNRKWAALAAASFAGMLLTGGLSIYALRARHEAIAQRGEAEGLIEYMLGDLRKKLEPVGRLDVMDSVGERALAYYSAQNAGALDADSLGRRARALHLIGEVDDLRGNLDHALEVFEQAAHSTGELLARAPNDGQRIFDHAQSVYWVGFVAFQRGQNEIAEKSFNEYRNLAERLVALDPGKDDWQAEVEYAYSNLGTLLVKEGRPAEAADAFRRSLKVSSALAAEMPSDTTRQLDDAQSHAWLADAQEKQGLLDQASEQRAAELEIYQTVLASDAKNNDAKFRLLVCRHALARLATARGNVSVAVEQLKTTTALADVLMQTEPDNTLWAEFDADAHASFGEALHFNGDEIAARKNIERATQIAQDLVKRDATVVRWRGYLLSRCQVLQALLDVQAGDTSAAYRLAHEIVQRIDALPEKDRSDPVIRWQLGAALVAMGDVDLATGDTDAAKSAWQRAVTVLETGQESQEPSMQTVFGTALLRLGKRDALASVVSRLDRIGYQHPDFIALKAKLSERSNDELPLAQVVRPASSVAGTKTAGRPEAPVR